MTKVKISYKQFEDGTLKFVFHGTEKDIGDGVLTPLFHYINLITMHNNQEEMPNEDLSDAAFAKELQDFFRKALKEDQEERIL